MTSFSLDGQVVVVTGGLGQLGRQYARAIQEAGGAVALVDRAVDGAPSLGDRVIAIAADVTDRGQLESALAEVTDRLGVPTGLVNNAALDSPPDAAAEENGPFESYAASSWDTIMAVNVKGVFLCCQVFGGAMASAGRGSVVNIASIYGMVSPDQRLYEHRRSGGEQFFKPAAYATSKAAVLNLTRYLATYWAEQGVRVNSLVLGGVRRDQDEAFLAAYAARTPLGRMAREDEYNGAVVFLLSDAASYMTGSSVVLDGGFTAW